MRRIMPLGLLGQMPLYAAFTARGQEKARQATANSIPTAFRLPLHAVHRTCAPHSTVDCSWECGHPLHPSASIQTE